MPDHGTRTSSARRSRHHWLAWPVIGLLAAAALSAVAVAPTSAASATCAGKPATIQGDGRYSTILSGTSGPDVIVSRGARIVDGKGGDDTICLTGKLKLGWQYDVSAGAGDDLVRNDATGYRGGEQYDGIWVSLDDGSGRAADDGTDTFVGGDQSETVVGRFGADQVFTGGGIDLVLIGSPSASQPDTDRVFDGAVDLGADGGSVHIGPWVDPTVHLDGGAGPSGLSFDDAGSAGTWSIDAASGVVRVDGETRYTSVGFSSYGLSNQDVSTFVGTDADESLFARSVQQADLGGGDDVVWADQLVAADLGPGDDQVFLAPTDVAGPREVVGGAGRDLLTVDDAEARAGSGKVDLDLRSGSLTYPSLAGSYTFRSIESFAMRDRTVTVTGTGGRDRIEVEACTVRVAAGAGKDRVRFVRMDPEAYVCLGGTAVVDAGAGDDVVLGDFPRATVLGGTGNDTLRGGSGPDALRGGRGDDVLVGSGGADDLVGAQGRDTARGGAGKDRCRAESERRCER